MEKLEKLLNNSFEQHEIYEQENEYKSISFESNKLKEISIKQSKGFAVRAIRNSGLTFSSSSNYDFEKFNNNFIQLSEFPTKTSINFPGKKVESKNKVKIFSKEEFNIDNKYFINKLSENIKKVLKKFPDALCDAEFDLGLGKSSLSNSNGLSIQSEESGVSFFISAQTINGNDMLNIYNYASSVKNIDDQVIESLTSKLIENLSIAQNIKKAPPKGCPVIFTPHGLYQTILSPLLVSFNGTNLSKNLSRLYKKENEKIFDKKISITDNPFIDYSTSSRNYDAEGITSQINTLIKRGRFISGIFDLKTSSEYNCQSTGSAERSIHSNTFPSTSNLIMDNGETSFDEMVKQIDEGILVDHLLGSGQGNELSGDFSANISLGYKIEKGQIVGRVKNTMISGNSFNALSKVDDITSEIETVYGSLKLPFLQTSNVEISS
jgi:PmbA protein